MRWISLLLPLTLTLAACATRTPAPVSERPPVAPVTTATAAPQPPPAPAPQVVDVASPAPPASPAAVPDWRPEFYTIKRGDTLFAIALEHGLDYRELAAMNNIENLNVIRVGQVLRVRAPGEAQAAGAGPATAPLVSVPPVTDARPVAPSRIDRPNTDSYKTQPKAIRLPYSDAALAQLQSARPETPVGVVVPTTPGTTSAPAAAATTGSAAPGPIGSLASVASPSSGGPSAAALPAAAEGSDEAIDWGWPVRGRLLSGFSETASLKGIDIGGAKGAPVIATAPGRVVYAGSGLRGYGKLVIVKHNKTYLSAYAHLDAISIREGQNVTKGQEIGKMGNSDADQVKLHFEIRSLGKPVDPMRFLPR